MLELLTYPRDSFDERNLDKEIVNKLIRKHVTDSSRLKKLKEYYLGRHEIEKHERRKGLPNFKTVCNHAKDIADTATGYFMGNAITYNNTEDADIEDLLKAFDEADVDQVDNDNALSMAIYGRAFEFIYPKEDEVALAIRPLDPEHTFFVYDDTIEQKPLFAVYYYEVENDVTESTTFKAEVFTETYRHSMILRDGVDKHTLDQEPTEHHMDGIPVIEYLNNRFRIGDYEQQIPLIDAYNSLTGNRVNDKEQAINAILVIYAAALADTPEEAHRAMMILREEGLLELPHEARAEFLSNALDESQVETLRRALKEDIYTFSHVPNLSDENFAGNSSGVAMEYKLLGLEMITKTKEQYYKRGLRQRIKLFASYLGMKDVAIDAQSIVPQFTRGLPKNLLELSQIVNNLEGKVSQRQLLSLLPFVEDPDVELEELKEEKEEKQEELHPFNSLNTPLDEELNEPS